VAVIGATVPAGFCAKSKQGLCLLWDFDGTLAYRRGGMWSAAMLEACSRYAPGLRLTADQLQPHLQTGFPWHSPGHPHPDLGSADAWWANLEPLLEHAYCRAGVEASLARRLAQRVRRFYSDPRRWSLYDDVTPALEALSDRGWTHAILSNHVPELRSIVAHLGLDAHMEHVINSAETGYEKPHPLAFRSALDAVGRGPCAVMIGDSMAADVDGAWAAGLPAILVRVAGAGYDYRCSTLSEVPDMLERLVGHRQQCERVHVGARSRVSWSN
jgi:putative hydrolase of the HAD superfamily